MGNANQRERQSTVSSEGDNEISVNRYRRRSLQNASQLPVEFLCFVVIGGVALYVYKLARLIS